MQIVGWVAKGYDALCGNFNMQEPNRPQLYEMPEGEYKPVWEAAV